MQTLCSLMRNPDILKVIAYDRHQERTYASKEEIVAAIIITQLLEKRAGSERRSRSLLDGVGRAKWKSQSGIPVGNWMIDI